PIAGLAITVMICYILAGTVRQLFYRMMDAVDPHLVDELAQSARGVEGVLDVHDVRARWIGRELAAVMHVDCDAGITLAAAHAIAQQVEHAVAHSLPASRLDIHMDPGTDPHSHSLGQQHDEPGHGPEDEDGAHGHSGHEHELEGHDHTPRTH
ncbi:MAG: hypothetical protein M3024_00460, partial [Candidatus Dormibacteraeota bacterium]|nr:hypothetical protein [Candidatus Dormibacteraeota bacterium]